MGLFDRDRFRFKDPAAVGVGLMGLRLAVADVVELGIAPVGASVVFVLATLALGVFLSFRFGRPFSTEMLFSAGEKCMARPTDAWLSQSNWTCVPMCCLV